ncbi:MAG: winged helix DNA-binding domain-containing protein [Thermoplasmata archaeon]|nr:MAG: winged helix DNA-binding domain-containing protein [Thermoplasmata archaeon]
MIEINEGKINSFCLKKQHLTDDSKINDIVKITKDIGGLHATSSATTYLSLFVRTNKFQRDYLNKELYVKRNLGKVRYVRGTIYVLPKDKIPFAYSAIRSYIYPLSCKYAEYHGISDGDYRRISKQILKALDRKAMTAKEIKKAAGIKSKISQILNLMCDDGQLIRAKPKGEWKSNLHTYCRMDQYFPGLELFTLDESEAKKQVILQYINSFGPVTLNDITWWTKFHKTKIRAILPDIEDEIIQVKVTENNEPHYILTTQKKALQSTRVKKKPMVNLLPTLDTYIMGYKDRERYIDLEYYDYVFDRSGNGVSSIFIDGKIHGVWDFAEKPEPIVKLFYFKDVKKVHEKQIQSKAKNIGKFIAGCEVGIRKCKHMAPLSKRTAGGFMSPLKDC